MPGVYYLQARENVSKLDLDHYHNYAPSPFLVSICMILAKDLVWTSLYICICSPGPDLAVYYCQVQLYHFSRQWLYWWHLFFILKWFLLLFLFATFWIKKKILFLQNSTQIRFLLKWACYELKLWDFLNILLLKKKHLNGFFQSWTKEQERKCKPYLTKFAFKWILFLYGLKLYDFLIILLVEMSHLNGFFPFWTQGIRKNKTEKIFQSTSVVVGRIFLRGF